MKKKYGKNKINHKTYVLAGDGCLMEGISHEALSLAGHLKLKNLVLLFDNNSISIDGPTNLAVSDDFKKRFNSYGWNYIDIDGHNEKQIFNALKKVQKSKVPSAISCKTIIGYGSPNKSGTLSANWRGSSYGPYELTIGPNAVEIIPIQVETGSTKGEQVFSIMWQPDTNWMDSDNSDNVDQVTVNIEIPFLLTFDLFSVNITPSQPYIMGSKEHNFQISFYNYPKQLN